MDLTYEWDWEYAWEILPDLLDGLWITIQATFFGIILAMILGLAFAILRRSEVRAISWPTAWVIEFIRSTPLLVQLFMLFYVLPHYGIRIDAFTTGVLALGIHYATYTSEVYRSGIEGVPRGQWEASTALNLSTMTTWSRVILPQAIPVVIPSLGNYLVAMFKEVPLLAFITVFDVLGEGKAACTRNFQCVEPYTLVGVLFLIVSIPSSILVRQLEVRLARQP
ncbi:MAG: ectoine/hydroxyectoine ABC transporter permease subunit EhuD [Dehalococcoidia bacterium]|nr:ectoine/hydroxyectoine ABC transporter permease subunit EhuD [Dehalococcoidia bacterium]